MVINKKVKYIAFLLPKLINAFFNGSVILSHQTIESLIIFLKYSSFLQAHVLEFQVCFLHAQFFN